MYYRCNPRRYSRYHIKIETPRSRLTSENDDKGISKVNFVNFTLESLLIVIFSQNIEASESASEEKCCGCIPMNTFNEILNLGLFKDRIFVMFVISNFLTSIGFNVPYVYTVVSKSTDMDSLFRTLVNVIYLIFTGSCNRTRN